MSVELNSVCKSFGTSLVIDEVGFCIPDGVAVGLSGVNGSGKTMLMRIAAGLVRPSSGFVEVDGSVIGRDVSFPPSLGVLIESPAFLDFRTGRKNLEILASIKGEIGADRVTESLEEVGLDPYDRRKYRKYSLGMRQRLGLAAVFMEHPRFIILDEPTNALDSDGIDMLKRLVAVEKKRGAAILLSCHDADILAELADVVHRIESGRIVDTWETGKGYKG